MRLAEDNQADERQQHLRELDVEHQIERPHMMLVHELVFVRSSAPVKTE